jgi:hypothetical protein
MYISIIYKNILFRTWPSNKAEIKAEKSDGKIKRRKISLPNTTVPPNMDDAKRGTRKKEEQHMYSK